MSALLQHICTSQWANQWPFSHTPFPQILFNVHDYEINKRKNCQLCMKNLRRVCYRGLYVCTCLEKLFVKKKGRRVPSCHREDTWLYLSRISTELPVKIVRNQTDNTYLLTEDQVDIFTERRDVNWAGWLVRGVFAQWFARSFRHREIESWRATSTQSAENSKLWILYVSKTLDHFVQVENVVPKQLLVGLLSQVSSTFDVIADYQNIFLIVTSASPFPSPMLTLRFRTVTTSSRWAPSAVWVHVVYSIGVLLVQYLSSVYVLPTLALATFEEHFECSCCT